MSVSFANLLALLNQQPVDFSTLHQDELFAIARSHRVINHVYKKLLSNPSTPGELLQKFKTESHFNQRIALQQMQTQIELKELLQQHDIPVIFFKGLLLSHRLYGDIGMRTSQDIDLIIPKEQLIVVDDLLQKKGYSPHFPFKLKQKYIKQIQFTYKDLGYSHPDNNTILELHWNFDYPYSLNIPFSEFWQQRATVQLMGHNFHVLANEDEWLYLCSHGGRHAWKRLHWLYDATHYYRQYPHMNKLQIDNKAKQYQVKKQLDLAVYLIKKYFSPIVFSTIATNNKVHRYTINTVQQQIISCEDILSPWSRIKLEFYLYHIYFDYKSLWYLLSNRVRRIYLLKWMEKDLPKSLFFIAYPLYSCYIINKFFKKLGVLLKSKLFN